MVKDILVETRPEQTRVAILEDGELAELFIETPEQEKRIGNIYRGKVERVLPGMQCAFIDIGLDRNAFLYAGDILVNKLSDHEASFHINNDLPDKIDRLVKQGQEITVQVSKEAIESKGPRVTTNISLPGRNTVLLPYTPGIGISKKITDPDERDRLKNIAKRFCPEDIGLIIRTAAEGLESSELQEDILQLLKMWDKIRQEENKGKVPRCIYKEPIWCRETCERSLEYGHTQVYCQ